MKKIKIVIMILNEPLSGIDRVVYGIVRNLKENSKVELTLIGNSEILNRYSSIKNVKKLDLGAVGKTIFNLRNRISKFENNLSKYLTSEKFDLIHLHSETPMEIYGRLKIDRLPSPISTFHGTDLITFSNSFLNNLDVIKSRGIIYFVKMLYYKNKIKPYLLNTLDKGIITLISKHQIQNLPEKYKKKTIVIPNGVDSKVFKPLKNIKQRKNVILFTGRFIELKGIRDILSVAKKLPQYEFWFVGQGPLANLINLPNTKNLGFKTTKELVKLYNQTTICIQPSYREGFPLVGLEAMSCQKAVIATPLGFSEYIENGKDGIIIPTKNEKALKDAILKLMTNEKLRKRLERNARKKALKYGWDKVAKQYLKVFKEAIK